MKLLVITATALALALGACNTTEPRLIKRQLVVVTPPESMYECPIKNRFPNWETLNDVEVAETVLELYKNNVKCKSSLDSIKKYLANAKSRLEK